MIKIKVFLFIACIVSVSVNVNAQTIKVENGVSLSKMKSNDLDLFTKTFTSYANKIGVEYFEHKYFYLSSKIGYAKRGGKNKIAYINELGEITSGNDISESWNLLSINTTFRVKYAQDKYLFYLGLGPFVDFFIGSKKFSNTTSESYKTKKNLYGVCPELGVDYMLADKISIGLNVSSNFSFTPLVKQDNLKLNNNQMNIYLSIGYKL